MDLSAANPAELSVIGSILIDPEPVMPLLMDQLRPEDFDTAVFRHLFAAARELYLDHKPVDAVTIGAAAQVEDYAALAQEIMRITPTAANVAEYAHIVREQSRMRALRAIGMDLAYTCQTSAQAAELLASANEHLLVTRKRKRHGWRELSQAFFDALDAPAPVFLDLGIPELTRAAKIRPGHFVILGAENSTGKTALALQIAVALAKSGKKVAFFSLETQPDVLMQRIMAQQSGVRLSVIQEHRLSREDYSRVAAVSQENWDVNLEICEAAGWTTADIRAATLANRCDVVIIDYVQLIQAAGDNPVMQLREISIQLHTMAQALGVTVIALSQITLPPVNKSTGRRAELTRANLNMSSQLANDADVVLLLYLSDPADYASPRVLKMDKNKDVGQGRMLLNFDGPRLRFSYLPPPESSNDKAARERTEKMDKNRQAKQAKADKQQAEEAALAAAFQELEGGEDGLPF